MDRNTRPTAPTAAPIPLTEDLPARLYGAVWGTDPTDAERTYLAECLDSYCVREAGSPLDRPAHPWQAVVTPEVRTVELLLAAILCAEDFSCDVLPGSAVGAWLREREQRNASRWDDYFAEGRRLRAAVPAQN